MPDELRELEELLLTERVRGSHAELDRLIADEFVELGSSGRTYDRAETIAALLASPKASVKVSDFVVRDLSQDVALVTYRTPGSLRSSIWRREAGAWRIVFHQGTPRTGE